MSEDFILKKFRALAFSKPRKVILEDVLGDKLTALGLYFKAIFLGGVLQRSLSNKKFVGLCLPNTNTFAIAFMALHTRGYVPVIFNYKSGTSTIKDTAHAVGTDTIITSRLFENKAGLSTVFGELKTLGLKFIYLEDLVGELSLLDKLSLLSKAPFTRVHRARAHDTAVVLFTSGSEGLPKGVALSHKNLISNVEQSLDRLTEINHDDVFFSSLPFFHTFGLLAGLILPMIYGVKSYIYPSPLDYKVIPQKIKDSKATIFFSANTFLQGYAMTAEPDSFANVKAIYAGAERLFEETIALYKEKFGVCAYEGYGVTEAAPIIAVNGKNFNKVGSVGKPLRDVEIRIETIEGYNEGGRLFVKGPNIMQGYYLAAQPGVLVKPHDGWHDTGDVAYLDEDGYLFIIGRAKRFAKIGGEMISLATIESCLSRGWPSFSHAVVSIKDPKKGEKIVLITNCSELKQDELLSHIHASGLSNLYMPKEIFHQESIPILSTGKVDYVTLEKSIAE